VPVAAEDGPAVDTALDDRGAIEGEAEAVLDVGDAVVVVDPVELVSSSVLTPEEPEQPVTKAVTASSAMAATARTRIPCSPG
jgi:hypothetical protein